MALRGRCWAVLLNVVLKRDVVRQRCSDATIGSKLQYSYAYGKSSCSLIGKTMGQILDDTVADAGDSTAFIFCHQNIQKTYSEFHSDVEKFASGLLALGLKKGDRVGVWSPNRYEWVVAQYATSRVGMILVTMNPAYQIKEMMQCIKMVRMNAIIISEPYKTQDFYSMLKSAVPNLPYAKQGQLRTSEYPSLQAVITLSKEPEPGTVSFSQVSEAADSEHRRMLHDVEKDVQFDDPVNIQFTSGTTGVPKAATLSHHNVINNAFYTGTRLGFHTEKSVLCVPVPLFHCFGCVAGTISSVIHKITTVFPSAGFSAEHSLEAIENNRCTVVYGTPTMYIDIMNHPNFEKYKINSLRTGIMAGSPCPIEVLKMTMDKLNMKDICIAYGTTENSPVTTMSSCFEPVESKLDNVGHPLDHVELKVIDSKGRIVPVNTEGEICTRGHTTFLGYLGDVQKTNEVVDSTRWYHTGDIGKMNETGCIFISGRIKDMIIRGGENIYPREIEDILHTHPLLAEVQVFGIPCERMGEEVCAWVKVKNGSKISEEEVTSFCKEQLSHFKIPKHFFFVDEFPKTGSGKIQKFVMREKTVKMLAQGHKVSDSIEE